MTPYSYPKTRHLRTQSPGFYSNYRSYKAHLKIEFERKCVYCCQPDSIAPNANSYGVDHYKPKSIFPQEATNYGNLFYCCSSCNTWKGNYWPKPSDLLTRFIPNPCDHVMFDHLRFQGASVIAKSSAGEFAVERLDLNDPGTQGFRRHLNLTITLFEDRLLTAKQLFQTITSAIEKATVTQGTMQQDLADLTTEIAGLESGLARYLGT